MNHDYIGSFWQCQMSQKPQIKCKIRVERRIKIHQISIYQKYFLLKVKPDLNITTIHSFMACLLRHVTRN